MLTREEFGITLKLYSALAKLNIFQFNVDLNTGELSRQNSILKKILWYFFFICTVLVLIYQNGRLFQSLLVPEYFVLGHFPVQVVSCLNLNVATYINYLAFVQWPGMTVGLFNQLFKICRAIGIPCRVVTNLESAHDANETLTIDKYYDEENKELPRDPFNPSGSKDSIWNFHVWNDVWMARPDLESGGNKGYGGWQAIDATPQETSEGVYQCGPASLEAVRRGQIGLAYDVPFLLAEVNADIVHWKRDHENKRGWRRMNADKFKIGRMILTKAPNVFDPNGEGDRLDVLSDYKGKEGSRAERLALYNAVTGKPNIASFYGRMGKEEVGDVEFTLVDLDKVAVGEVFSVVVNIQNKSKEPRTVQADLSVASMFYTGIRAKEIKMATGKFIVRPNAKEELKLTVRPEEYMKKLVEYGIMKIFAICAVDETTQSWCAEDDFQVIKPCLTLQVEPELKLQIPASVKMSFKNPLRRTLTECSINYEGPGFIRTKAIPQPNVGPLADFSYEYQFVPKNVGNQRIVISFTSVELTDIIGSAIVDII